MGRVAEIRRTTNETDVEIKLNIDGTGIYKIASGNAFMDHMLNLFTKHGDQH